MKNKNGYFKSILLLILAVMLPIILYIFIGIIDLYIALVYPDITYKGDRTVPEEDVIRLEKITLRDLKQDIIYSDNTCSKYYIIKKNHLSKKRLYEQLSQYCSEYYNNDNYDEIGFFFYEECSTMPWFWNNDGYFPDLEINSEHRICGYRVTKDGISLREGY